MVQLDPAAVRYVRTWMGASEGPGLLALRHALAYRSPGLWGDHPVEPRSVVLIREGDGQLEVFGAGEPEPAVAWIVGHLKAFTLHAPEGWAGPVGDRVGEVEQVEIETWSAGAGRPIKARPRALSTAQAQTSAPTSTATPARVITRRLSAADRDTFTAAVPAWGLRGWRSFSALVEYGAAFGVPFGTGLASVAWVFDQADGFDALGVFTAPRFRRLGLGRAAALALIDHVKERRSKVPLWSVNSENEPSRSMARALGFSVAVTETLLRWPPRTADSPDSAG